MTGRRIALIHATRLAMAPVEAAFVRLWPGAETVSILDEGLSRDRASGQADEADLSARIGALADHAMRMGPAAILFTCSAFGACIDAAAARLPIPVLKPNEAMFEAALARGRRLAMLYTFPATGPALAQEFATASGGRADLEPVFVPGAMEALAAGDPARHDCLIADAARGLRADAILLAQFSMTDAAAAVRSVTGCPVLTSPDTAVEALRLRLGAGA